MTHEHTAANASLEEVLAVLDALVSAGCRIWVAAGWGVDALVGRQACAHCDPDLASGARHVAIAVEIAACLLSLATLAANVSNS